MHVMMEHRIRRLPVVDVNSLVGMVSQADLALNLDEAKSGEFLRTISAAP
jgi:CBS domain-containing protein